MARRRENLTQAQQAHNLGMLLGHYKKAEDDRPPDGIAIAIPPLGRVRSHESCMIERRREGLTLGELAELVGVSKWWLCQMERGTAPVDRLAEYWASE